MAPVDMSSKHAACAALVVLRWIVMTRLYGTGADIYSETD